MENGNKDFNFQKALQAIRNGQALLGKEGILNPLIKQLTEAALEGKIDSHLARELSVNRRNGKSKKTIKIAQANRSTESSNYPRHEIEGKIIGLYGLGMRYRDISSHLQEMPGLEIPSGTLAAATDKILQTLKAWQARPLEGLAQCHSLQNP